MDLLTRREFEAGFGSHTPIFSGQTRCVRYYMNFKRGLELFKEVLLEVWHSFPEPIAEAARFQGHAAHCFLPGALSIAYMGPPRTHTVRAPVADTVGLH